MQAFQTPVRARVWPHVLSSVALAALAACGGGGDPASSLSISGIAAQGAAMAGAKVTAKCASGSGTTDVQPDGNYEVTVNNGGLPCVLEATSTDGMAVLHSLVAGSGSSSDKLKANVTPITELVLAQALGSSVSDIKNFDVSVNKDKLAADKVTSATNTVKEVLKTLDANNTLSSDFDPLKTTFTPKVGNTAGDAKDQLIDKLVAAVKTYAATDSTSTPQLKDAIQAYATAVVNATSAASSGSGSSTAAADVGQLLQTPVTDCPAAKNVNYRLVSLGKYAKLTSVDWTKGMTATWTDGSTSTDGVKFSSDTHAKASCAFTYTYSPSSGAALPMTGVLAPSGLFVLRNPGNSSYAAGLVIGFPEQTVSFTDLKGTWNLLEYSIDTGRGWSNSQHLLTLDGSGKVTAFQDCSGTTLATSSCTSQTGTDAPASLKANSEGGFDVLNAGGNKLAGPRVFAFRSANGWALVISVNDGKDNKGVIVGARQAPLKLPAKDAVTDTWEGQASVSASTSTMTSSTRTSQYTVSSVDTAANSLTRTRTLLNDMADGMVDKVLFEQPRQGLRFREAGSYTLAGTSTSFPNAVQMPVPGVGLTVTVGDGSTSKFLYLSVVR